MALAPKSAATLAALTVLTVAAVWLLGSPLFAQDPNADQPPAVPTGLVTSPTFERVGLSWDDPGDPSITHYEVYRRDLAVDAIGVFHLIEPNSGSAATSWVDTSVAAEGSYVYRVKAVNPHGASQWSRFARADTPAAPVIERIPEEPLVALLQMSVATLVKNTGQTAESSGLALSSTTPRRAQAFTTGANPAGYALSSIGIQFQAIDTPASAGGELTVTLNADGSGSPGDALCTLADPASFSANSLNTFSAPTTGMGACPALTMETTYFVVVMRANDTTDSIELSYTDSDSEDTLTPASNWAIGDDRQGYDGTTWTTDAGESLMLEVRGAAENNPATGAPSIQGILQQDEELTADTVGIADPDGVTTPNFTYQWIRVDSSDVETPISGATSSSYTLTTDDVDHKIKLKIDFSDDAGNAESLTSAATPVVVESGATHELVWLGSMTSKVSPGFSGFICESVLGSLSPASFTANGTNRSVCVVTMFFNPASSTFALSLGPEPSGDEVARWSIVLLDSRFALADATPTPLPGDVGYEWDATGLSLDDSALWEDGAQIVVMLQSRLNLPPTGAPSIQGILQQGEELTADTVGIADPDGLSTPNFTYQWIRVDDSDVETPISGATSSTYTLTTDDVEHKFKLKIDFSDDAGNAESLTSAATPVVVESGATHRLLWAATIDVESFEDSEGENFGYSQGSGAGAVTPSSFRYREGTLSLRQLAYTVTAGLDFFWFKFDRGLSLDHYSKLTMVIAEQHHYTFSDTFPGDELEPGLYASFSLFITPPEMTPGWLGGETTSIHLLETLNAPPEGAPSIQGILQVGEELTADTAGIVDPDGLTTPNFTYQWIRVDANNNENDISDATSATYTLVDDDLGNSIKVRVGFTDDENETASLTSSATPAVVASGAASKLLWIADLAVAEADTGFAGFGPGSVGSLNPTMFGIGSATYRISFLALDGGRLGLVVNPDPGSAESNSWIFDDGQVRLAFPAEDRPPSTDDYALFVPFTSGSMDHWTDGSEHTVSLQQVFNVAASGIPTISGTAETGEALTAGVTDIADANGLDNAEFSYQWVRISASNVPTEIPGATGSTYRLSQADVGHTIVVKVSFTDDDGYTEGPLSSDPTATVTLAPGLVLSATELTVPEGGSTTYTAKLSVAPSADVTVTISASGDITLSSTTPLTFTSTDWNSTQQVTVSAVQDTDALDDQVELTHTFSGEASEYTNRDPVALPVTVEDDEPAAIAVAAVSSSVAEGDDASFTITRTGRMSRELVVQIEVEQSGEVLEAAAPTSVTFAAGQTVAQLTLATDDDLVVEGDSDLTLTVLADTETPATYLDGASAVVLVTDDDMATLAFSVDETTITESGGETSTVTVAIDNGVTFRRQQTIAISLGGTATPGSDFTFVDDQGRTFTKPYTLRLAAGADQVTGVITALDDRRVDAAETITVSASYQSTAVGTAHTITITDDDEAPTLALTGLTITSTNARSAYPAFAAAIEHYAVGCGSGDTVTITPTAPSGTRIAVDGSQVTSGNDVALTGLEGDADIAILLSNASGQSRRYTVHCLPDDFPSVKVTDNGSTFDGLILGAINLGSRSPGASRWTFLTILDTNGVPRFQRKLAGLHASHFKPTHGPNPFGYLLTASSTDNDLQLLDEQFNDVRRVGVPRARPRTSTWTFTTSCSCQTATSCSASTIPRRAT